VADRSVERAQRMDRRKLSPSIRGTGPLPKPTPNISEACEVHALDMVTHGDPGGIKMFATIKRYDRRPLFLR
jgi:hypothetical protein